MSKPTVGSVGWIDLTVLNAIEVRDFYKHVVGWKHTDVPCGDHSDFCVGDDPENNPVAGICHALGENRNMPPQWLIYIVVADIDESIRQCEANGGTVEIPIRSASGGQIAVIRDPAGAVCALYEA